MKPTATDIAGEARPEEERYYAADSYLLPSDEVERERLQLQHDMLKKRFTAELLPSALALRDGDKILDAGCGSGAWTSDVAMHVPPKVCVIGVDIEPRLFPAPLPNTEFHVHSTLALPSEWSSTFTFAHQRLMIVAFSSEAWKTSISELYRVLRPGGWIRLEEIDSSLVASEGLPPEPPLSDQFVRASKVLCERRNVGSDCLLELSQFLTDAGFEDVDNMKKYIPMGPGDQGRDVRNNWIGAWRGMKVPILKAGGFGIAQTSDEFDHFMDRVLMEWETSECGRMFISWTARKPM